jgi:acetyltransferase-like isoleucine patch superfamily enzyme
MRGHRLKEALYKLLYSPETFARKLGATIGADCRIYTYYWGSEPWLIEIGDHVHITRDVKFVTHDGGVWVFRDREPDVDAFGKIKIGDNTFIGNEALILPGVTIGSNCVIGAMSVITRSVPDNSVVAGNPAKFICTTDEYYDRIKEFFVKSKSLPPKERERFLRNLPVEKLLVKRVISREKIL